MNEDIQQEGVAVGKNEATSVFLPVGSRPCIHHFDGASRKGAPFFGWAGPVESWPEKKAPVIGFGKWVQNPISPYGGGDVTFTCPPLAIVMWGANSKQMRTKDKTTHFGFAGLAPFGNLHIVPLPQGTDARALFTQGGWQHPDIDAIIEQLTSATNNNVLTLGDYREVIASTKLEICSGFGITSTDFESTLSSWPMLAPIFSGWNSLIAKVDGLRSKANIRRRRQAYVDVGRAVRKLEVDGIEVTQMNIAALLLNHSEVTNHKIKEKVRKLKQLLGTNFEKVAACNKSIASSGPAHLH